MWKKTVEIKRDGYLNRLIARKWNGAVKVVTGIRRCGKSYLLFKLFRDHLLSEGVEPGQIIAIALDDIRNKRLRDPEALYSHVAGLTDDRSKGYYVLLDEIQYVDGFEDAVNGMRHLPNLDVYVTGSNSRFLSSDILTEFRGRGDEVRVRPLSFSEFLPAHGGGEGDAWEDYLVFGGMPEILSKKDDEQKASYLKNLVDEVYLKDISDRNRIHLGEELGLIVDSLSSSVGSLTNPTKIANTLRSAGRKSISHGTVSRYLELLEESYLFEKARRYDVKGRKYLDTPHKYFMADMGLRNARLNFRQQERTHLMENVIYNELRSRGYSVDVGLVETRASVDGSREYKQLEIDFVVNKGDARYYIQSAYGVHDEGKREREIRPFRNVPDSFMKILVVGDEVRPWTDDEGILTVGVRRFLLDPEILRR
ncbi:MAG: ATP-binding protein [Thermoplasmatales archaeon]|nr:ATP-binding protein [Thermoplasmatales archaeon]